MGSHQRWTSATRGHRAGSAGPQARRHHGTSVSLGGERDHHALRRPRLPFWPSARPARPSPAQSSRRACWRCAGRTASAARGQRPCRGERGGLPVAGAHRTRRAFERDRVRDADQARRLASRPNHARSPEAGAPDDRKAASQPAVGLTGSAAAPRRHAARRPGVRGAAGLGVEAPVVPAARPAAAWPVEPQLEEAVGVGGDSLAVAPRPPGGEATIWPPVPTMNCRTPRCEGGPVGVWGAKRSYRWSLRSGRDRRLAGTARARWA